MPTEQSNNSIPPVAARLHMAVPSMDSSVWVVNGRRIKLDEDLLFTQASKTWDDLERVRRDDDVFVAFRGRIAITKSAEWRIDYASEDARAVEISDFCRRTLEHLNLRELIGQMLEGVNDGFAVAEIIWDNINGRIVPLRIASKPARWFWWTDDGELLFTPDGGSTFKDLPPRKFLYFRHMHSATKPYGIKMLSMAYWLYYFKKHARQFESIFIEKFSIPPVIGSYSADARPADIDAVNEAIQGLSTDFGAMVPDTVKVEIIKDIAKGESPHAAVVRACGRGILKLYQGGTLTVEATGESGNGSRSMGEVHEGSLMQIAADDAAEIERLMNDFLQWLVDYNFGVQENYPKLNIVLDPEQLDVAWCKNAMKLMGKGVKVSKAELYRKAQITPPAEDEETLGGEEAAVAEDNSEASPAFAADDVPQPVTMSADEAARSAERTSNRLRDEWLEAIALNGDAAVDKLRYDMEALFGAVNDGDDAAKLSRALTAVNQRSVRLALAALYGAEKKAPTGAQLKRLSKQVQKKLSISADAAAAMLKAAPLYPALYESITRARLMGRLLGMYSAVSEARAQMSDAEFAAADFAAVPDMSEWKVQPEAAIKAMRSAVAVTPDAWKKMSSEERATAFTYADAPEADLIEFARRSLVSAIEDGTTYEEFRSAMSDEYARRGLGELDDWYTRTVFYTNVLSSYARGRYEQFSTPAMAGHFPYYAYDTAGDDAVRPEHQALKGVYRRDDPIVETIWPPNGYNCRCAMRPVSEARLADLGGEVRTGAQALREMPESYRAAVERDQATGFGSTKGWK